ncbi:MAG: polyribonucleotide nucleotidyltransferase [Nitrospirae bacterium]|nr:polyribonucleotide nucleotidyltransferase [Nitrospirota bacterium]
MSVHSVEIRLAEKPFSFETGKVATLAHGAVVARLGDTIVLSTVVAGNDRLGIDFLPLSVDYLERTSAAGKIPGSYFRREGRLSEKETITSRLIDRPIRPLFPKGWTKDTQIIATVLQYDQTHEPDVVAVNASACALLLSSLPFSDPIGCVRVGRVDGAFVINPTDVEMAKSDLDIIVVAKRDAIVMVEGSAKGLPEEQMLEALFLAHDSILPILDMQLELLDKVKPEKPPFQPLVLDADLQARIRSLMNEKLPSALSPSGKKERREARKKAIEVVTAAVQPEGADPIPGLKAFIEAEERRIVRRLVLAERRRLDGRGARDIRDITCEVSVLPRTHGSALFTRGETQAIVVTTLGSSSDEQRIDALSGDIFKSFMLHYNFPPFSVGEVKPLRAPARREVGHGNLAERAIRSIMPAEEAFPYTVRVVSDILQSNGSSSMATVCGATLSLMDAGVPIKAPVAGIAMGLIKEGDDVAILTDILGDEDHLGDMDFKVAGTREGVTALQMDIKIDGLKRELLAEALSQAHEARLRILDTMAGTLEKPRESISPYAPRIFSIKIQPDKIRLVIGPGGKNIKAIIEKTNVKIDVENSGDVNIFATSKEAADAAIAMIREMAQEYDIQAGTVYKGKVDRIENYGAFVELFPGLSGLLHISEMDVRRVERVTDIVHEGDEIEVKVLSLEPNGRIRLSRRALLEGDAYREGAPREGERPREDRGERGERGDFRGRGGRGRGRPGPGRGGSSYRGERPRDFRGERSGESRGPSGGGRGFREDGPQRAPREAGYDRYDRGPDRREGGRGPREGGYDRPEGGRGPREGGPERREREGDARQAGPSPREGERDRYEGGRGPREEQYDRPARAEDPREGGEEPQDGRYDRFEGGDDRFDDVSDPGDEGAGRRGGGRGPRDRDSRERIKDRF